MVAAAKIAQVPEPRRALLSVEEVAELLQVPVFSVYDTIRSRGIIAFLDPPRKISAFRRGEALAGREQSGDR